MRSIKNYSFDVLAPTKLDFSCLLPIVGQANAVQARYDGSLDGVPSLAVMRPGFCKLRKGTAKGSKMQTYSNLLYKTIRATSDEKAEKVVDSLFSRRKTPALVNTTAGLDDFELISFLVIQEAG